MTLLDQAKIALRVDNEAFDEEIEMLIEAAKLDLQESGIDLSSNDGLINTAIIMFVKSNFGYDNLDSGKQFRAYDAINRKMAPASRWY